MARYILFVIFAGISCQCTSIIPPFIKICYRDDPKLNDCIERSVEALRPFLRGGIPELGVPSCEPLEIAEVKFAHEAKAGFIKSKYTNIIIHGGTNFIIKNITADMQKNNIELEISIPQLSMTADYIMNGLNVNIEMQGIRYKHRETNQTHLYFAKFTVTIDIGHGQIYLDNLFNGYKKLGDGMNRFLNDNYKMMSTEWKPMFETKIGENLKNFTNQIFGEYPLDLLFPLNN